MTISINNSVFSKYREVVDAMISDLGVSCKLYYLEKIEEIGGDLPNLRDRPTIRPGFGPMPHSKNSKKYKTVEKTETVTLRAYWSQADLRKVGRFVKIGDIDQPDVDVFTIGHISDLPKIERAQTIQISSDLEGYKDWRFEKSGEPQPWGLGDKRYFIAFWKRA